MIKVIHRVNTISGLARVPPGCGVEIDIRNEGSRLILNHEPFEGGESFEDFCSAYNHKLLVLNVKTEGIEEEVLKTVKRHGIKDYFFLDLTFPKILELSAKGEKNIAVRFSEYEPIENALCLKGKVKWVWVDTFTKLPLTKKIYQKISKASFKVFLVSPERWGRLGDIKKYKKFFKKEKILIDAVMASHELISEWD